MLRKFGLVKPVPDPSTTYRWGDLLLASLLGAYLILTIVDRSELPPLTAEGIVDAMVFLIGVVAAIFVTLSIRNLSPVKLFGFAPKQPGKVLLIGILCLLATYPICSLLADLVSLTGRSPTNEDPMIDFIRSSEAWGDRSAALVLTVVVAPFVEEFLFRGYLLGVLRQYCGRIAAIVVTSLIFAAIHQNFPAMPSLFVLALGFSLAVEMTGSLLAPIIMHVLFNVATVVVLIFFPDIVP